MRKILFMSLLGAMLLVPIYAARHANPLRAARRTAFWFFVFAAIYATFVGWIYLV